MRLLLFFIILLFVTPSFAQTEKGKFFIKGASNASFNIQQDYNYNETEGLNSTEVRVFISNVSLNGVYHVSLFSREGKHDVIRL
jgi:hypothetical protein